MVYGRKREIEQLKELFESKEPAFLAVYGRRRIGKTFLIHEFFGAQENCEYFEATGVPDGNKKDQLKNFGLLLPTNLDAPLNSWTDALHALWRHLEGVPASKKVVVFFDELPWLASAKSGFLPALDFFWNRLLSRRPNSLLIVCGSAAAWMIRKVINHRGGLHNRVTHRMPMQPFTIAETEAYLAGKGVQLNRKQVLDIYMAFGGVALYLNQVAPGLSAAENIERSCFQHGAFLADEFERLYSSLYGAANKHVEVVRALSTKRKGMQSEEIASATGYQSGGTLTQVLDELERSGFIMSTPETGKRRRGRRFRLIDEYSLFYLSWIEPQANTTVRQGTWLRLQQTGRYHAWTGYAFENFCFRHHIQLVRALKLEVVVQSVSTWSAPSTNGVAGAQIDLVLDRYDRCTNLCEMKYSDAEFKMTPAIAKNLNHKRLRFRDVTRTKKQLFTTLVSTFGATPNAAYLDAVDQQVNLDDFFN